MYKMKTWMKKGENSIIEAILEIEPASTFIAQRNAYCILINKASLLCF